jgi:hypothetical protein
LTITKRSVGVVYGVMKIKEAGTLQRP